MVNRIKKSHCCRTRHRPTFPSWHANDPRCVDDVQVAVRTADQATLLLRTRVQVRCSSALQHAAGYTVHQKPWNVPHRRIATVATRGDRGCHGPSQHAFAAQRQQWHRQLATARTAVVPRHERRNIFTCKCASDLTCGHVQAARDNMYAECTRQACECMTRLACSISFWDAADVMSATFCGWSVVGELARWRMVLTCAQASLVAT